MKFLTLHRLLLNTVFAIGLCICFSVETHSTTQQIDPDFKRDLSIFNTKSNYSIIEGYGNISCIGKIRNNSKTVWNDLVIEVQYFNSNNELIDTTTEHINALIVPSNDEVAFRVSDSADKNKNEYYSHKVRITSAFDKKNCKPSNNKSSNAFIEMLISWLPLLLIIAVWIFFIRKYQGENSPQVRILQIQEKQYLLLEEQNKLFQKLIDVIEKK